MNERQEYLWSDFTRDLTYFTSLTVTQSAVFANKLSKEGLDPSKCYNFLKIVLEFADPRLVAKDPYLFITALIQFGKTFKESECLDANGE